MYPVMESSRKKNKKKKHLILKEQPAYNIYKWLYKALHIKYAESKWKTTYLSSVR